MMSRHVTEPANWGEERLAAREAQRRRTRRNLVGWVLLIPLAIVMIEGFPRGFAPSSEGRPLWAGLVIAAGYVALLSYALWRTWREDDEVEWRMSVNALAAMGVATLLLNPAADIVATVLHTSDLRETLWLMAVMIGMLTYAWQRWRS